MRTMLPLKIAFASLAVAACVTINVYFPAAAAEKAADQIIDAVTSQGAGPARPAPAPSSNAPAPNAAPARSDEPLPKVEPSPPPNSRAQARATPLLLPAAGRLLQLLVPAAQAQEANLDVSTPEVRAVTASMQQRFPQLQKYFDAGVVGLTADGLVQIRDQNSVPLPERATVKQLVAEDNKDRETLYAEIAKANSHPEWEPQIRRTFARRWIERGARPGWYYQNASGAWTPK